MKKRIHEPVIRKLQKSRSSSTNVCVISLWSCPHVIWSRVHKWTLQNQ